MAMYEQQTPYRGDLYAARMGENLNAIFDRNGRESIDRGRRLQMLQEYARQLDGGDEAAPTGDGTDDSGELIQGGGQGGDGEDPGVVAGKKATALRNLVKTYNPGLKDHVSAMGLDQLEGYVKGIAVKSQLQDQAAGRQLKLAQLADYLSQTGERKQRAADDQSVGDATRAYAVAEGSPRDRFNAALKTPGLAGRTVPSLLETLRKYTEATDDGGVVTEPGPYPGLTILRPKSGRGGVQVIEDPALKNPGETLTTEFVEDPVSGQRFANRGRTTLPSGVNPDKSAPKLIPQHDADGNLVGWSHVDAKGRGTFIGNKSGAVFRQATDANGNDIPGYYVDSNGKAHDTRSVMEKTMGDAMPGATAKPAADKASGTGKVATPKTQAEVEALPSGAVFIGKDGKKYRKL